jgi:hypothetical protein
MTGAAGGGDRLFVRAVGQLHIASASHGLSALRLGDDGERDDEAG